MSARLSLAAGVALGGLAVALGAFGAHWLSSAIESWDLTPELQARRLGNWETAVRYQMYHALALIGLGLYARRIAGSAVGIASLSMLVGTLIFSGCLYTLVLTNWRILGMIVPIGGALMLVGWTAWLFDIWRKRPRPELPSHEP